MTSIPVAETVAALRRLTADWRARGERIGFVPTMGALHEGHVSLVRLARERADRVVVSIFVNPTQFAPGEDLASYPRTFAQDCARLEGLADLVYAPSADDMYPPGSATVVSVGGPASVGLEDRFRPTHFAGVATVVAKLLIQVAPDLAVFGEKDYQQLKVVTRLAADLSLPVEIVPGHTVREPDGLAMSSRNRYLGPQQRAQASALPQVLQDLAGKLRGGADAAEALPAAEAELTAVGFAVDYLELRDADSLEPLGDASRNRRLLVAARIGTTRLIDNIPV